MAAGLSIEPTFRFIAVNPSDTAYLIDPVTKKPARTKGIYIGVAGDVVALSEDGAAITFAAMAAGVIHPICTDKIMAATSATNLVACF